MLRFESNTPIEPDSDSERKFLCFRSLSGLVMAMLTMWNSAHEYRIILAKQADRPTR
jgi:hypothetical protein